MFFLCFHLSAGIGRTGTFIALNYLVQQAKESGYVDVFECVETLKRQRLNMVQTLVCNNGLQFFKKKLKYYYSKTQTCLQIHL